MNIKKTVKKIVALGTGTAMVGMTLMGALAAAPDLADYPDFVMDGGQFDGKIVVGAAAAAQDIVGAIDLAASLQAASTSDVAISEGTTSTTIEGDAAQVADSGNILEVGEAIGSVIETLSDDDLAMLQDGRITTQKGTTSFNQLLQLSQSAAEVTLDENHDDVTGYYLYFPEGDTFFQYELEFTSGLESDIDASDNAEDFEDESIFMLGQYYSIVNTDVDDALDDLTLELIAGDIVDTLTQGETKTYTVDGADYEVTVLVIGNDGASVKFLVNGEVTDSMGEGDTDSLSDGLEIGIREIIETTQYLESQPGSVVEFYLGANKIIFTDTDYTSTSNGGTVEINTESISDATVELSATDSNDDIRLNRITYTFDIDSASRSNVFVEAGTGVREYLDEPEGMLNAEWDIMFAGMSEPSTAEISFDAQGDDQYDLTFMNRRGDEITVPFVYTTSGGTLSWGDDQDDFHFYEVDGPGGGGTANESAEFQVALDDYFVLSDIGADTAADNADDTYVLRFNDVNEDDSTVTFENVAESEEITATYTGTANATITAAATGEITIGTTNYDFWFYEPTTGVYAMAVDMNNNGNLTNDEFIDVVTKNGGVLTLADDTDPNNGWTATLTTLAEDVDANAAQTLDIDFTDDGAGELDLDVNSGTSTGTVYSQDVRDEDRTVTVNAYGVWMDETTPSDSPGELTISYPSEQVEALVYVVGGDVQQSETTTGGSSAQRVNVLSVGLAVLDSEVSVDDTNLLVVGGPCANTIAAELLGNPADCAEGFEAGMGMIRTFETGDNVAVLVAGFSAEDTVQSTQVLARAATAGVDELMGDHVEVVVAGANDVTVRAAMEEEEEAMDDMADDSGDETA